MRDFKHSLNVLVRAYMNDTLAHADCCACAVGNMIADGLGCKVQRREGRPHLFEWDKYLGYYPGILNQGDGWALVFVTDWMFNGLMAVVEVLSEIHKVDLKEEAKLMFAKA